MQACNAQGVLALNVGNEAAASCDSSGELQIPDIGDRPAAENRVPMPGYARNSPILLNRGVRMTGQCGDLVNLRAIAGAPASEIDLLKTDHVMGCDLLGDVLQCRDLRRGVNKLEVRTEEVIPIPACSDARLDIPSQQVHEVLLSRVKGSRSGPRDRQAGRRILPPSRQRLNSTSSGHAGASSHRRSKGLPGSGWRPGPPTKLEHPPLPGPAAHRY